MRMHNKLYTNICICVCMYVIYKYVYILIYTYVCIYIYILNTECSNYMLYPHPKKWPSIVTATRPPLSPGPFLDSGMKLPESSLFSPNLCIGSYDTKKGGGSLQLLRV